MVFLCVKIPRSRPTGVNFVCKSHLSLLYAMDAAVSYLPQKVTTNVVKIWCRGIVGYFLNDFNPKSLRMEESLQHPLG